VWTPLAADLRQVARRIALALLVLLAASIPGALLVRAQSSAKAAPAERLVTRRIALRASVPRRPVRRRVDPGDLIARIRPGHGVVVRSAPGGRIVARLSAQTDFGSPQTLAVTETRADRRLAVVSTALPNGRVGWVDARPGTFRFAHTRVSLEVDLSRQELRVHVGKRVVRRIAVGIGAAGTTTPIGRFSVTDKLDGARYSPVYGCCILALSGHQTNLPDGWTGGDRLAIHAGSVAGAVSTGCIHAATTDLTYLMRVVPLGALVTIHP
jgi:hypothetical protein